MERALILPFDEDNDDLDNDDDGDDVDDDDDDDERCSDPALFPLILKPHQATMTHAFLFCNEDPSQHF